MKLLSLLFICAPLAASCGADALPYEEGVTHELVSAPADQIHPDVEGDMLVWFDLAPDPNGACHVPYYGPDWDPTCEGVVRGMNLHTGQVSTLSDVIVSETRPRVSDGRVVWRCHEDGLLGMCETPFGRNRVTFHEGLGWSRYGYDDAWLRTADDGGVVVWTEYTTHDHDYVWRLMRADVRTGEARALAYLDQEASEMVASGGQAAWTSGRWTGSGYTYRLQIADLYTGERRILLEEDRPTFGLGAGGGTLAWKKMDDEGNVHVYFMDDDGTVARADSEKAMVSSETRVAVGDDLLVWLDHRDGDYRIAAVDLRSGAEEILSDEEAWIGVNMEPSISGDLLVWPDLRNGDWDLFLYRF